MKKTLAEYILLFRMDITTKGAQPSAEQMKVYMAQWDKWVKSIASKNRLATGGHHLSAEGKVLKPKNVIKDGPYTKKNKSVVGYILIKAANFGEAVKTARDCPILQGKGTSVEVRKIEER